MVLPARSGGVSTSNGAGCVQTRPDDRGNGHSISMGVETDTYTGDTKARIDYNIRFGVDKRRMSMIDCKKMYDIEVQKQQVELQREQLELYRLQLEIDLMKKQIAQAQGQMGGGLNSDGTYNSLVGDDW